MSNIKKNKNDLDKKKNGKRSSQKKVWLLLLFNY